MALSYHPVSYLVPPFFAFAKQLPSACQAILLGAVLLLGARRVFEGTMTGQQLTTFVFYTQFVTSASFDVGDQVKQQQQQQQQDWCGDVEQATL